MKNLLGIVGSPRRKGNTATLIASILEGAEREGAVADLLFLGDLDIRECDGCHVCWEGKDCAKGDDMNALYPKIMQSDAIVLGTPVYWYGPTALMKAFIDRLVYFNCPQNRETIRRKPAVIAVPFEEEDPKTAALLIAMLEKCLHYLEMDLVGSITVPGVSRRGDILTKANRLQEAYELGRSLVGGRATGYRGEAP